MPCFNYYGRKAIRNCETCGAEFGGVLERDEDGAAFVHFNVSPFEDCSHPKCTKETCSDCRVNCVECNAPLCSEHFSQTDDGRMCATCAAEYQKLIAEEAEEQQVGA